MVYFLKHKKYCYYLLHSLTSDMPKNCSVSSLSILRRGSSPLPVIPQARNTHRWVPARAFTKGSCAFSWQTRNGLVRMQGLLPARGRASVQRGFGKEQRWSCSSPHPRQGPPVHRPLSLWVNLNEPSSSNHTKFPHGPQFLVTVEPHNGTDCCSF